jgi:2'-hydroxyisoflavone reductase
MTLGAFGRSPFEDGQAGQPQFGAAGNRAVNVLVLGGTVFFGRHLVAALLARGHAVTTFNRGTHPVDVALPVTRITGDRTVAADLALIPPDGWDAVVDPSSDVPDVVAAAAHHLRTAKRYVYISSISVYDLSQSAIAEDARVLTNVEGDPQAMTAEAYGWRKATSESRVAETFGLRATRLRPGLIVGPYDPTDRFTYWPVRVAHGGDVLVPGPRERAVQFVDVRDVADFTVRAIETGLAGVYNVTSPRGHLTMGDLIDVCRDGVESLPVVHWVDGTFLSDHGCAGWIDLPLWLPPHSPYPGILDADVSRAVAAGLRFRPLDETVRETRDWFAGCGRAELTSGLNASREKELLDSWNAVISS